MNRADVEKTLKDFGFVSEAGENTRQDEMMYTMPKKGYGNVVVNGTELYVNDWKWLRVYVDNYGIAVRLYCDYNYIGCIVESWDDMNDFELREGL